MSETTITATHLRQNLGAVLDSVFGGRTVHVIRNGRPLCTLVPPTNTEGRNDELDPDSRRGESDR
ncbi:type II toxin-antitoxin system Phd/YefM family antitoxin [Streptomyces griseoaurantiacus]|uniref:type II toxin-antitoxin system Phd/YefM family antitoxin n=1 Tax=Streptomyces griseoaurantiacus TaxID=68213 RepID=UPI0030E25D5A